MVFRLLFSLSWREQLKLSMLGLVLITERLMRGVLFFIYEILLLVPGKPLLDWLYAKLSILSGTFSYGLDSSKPELSPSSKSREYQRSRLFMNTHELCKEMGITCQDFYVDTLDGFTLRLHRLLGNPQGPPVLIQHGLMMSDEAFVYSEECSVAKCLHDAGFDVWLGNNRGNKYSWKHEKYSRNDPAYWNFTIDEIARYDVPAMINCALYFSDHGKITYLGFSNGCAQIFAAFQEHPELVHRIQHIVGLSPAVKIQGLYGTGKGCAHGTKGATPSNGFLYPCFFSPESKLFLRIFGDRAWLPSVDKWKRILTPERFTSVLDYVMGLMFNWTLTDSKIDFDTRCTFYYHLFSTTSSKHVHHWMQLIGQQQFVGYRPASGSFMGDVVTMDYDFDIMDNVPLTCLIGTDDSLIDLVWMKQRFKTLEAITVPGYEHLDFLCHRNVQTDVLPLVKRIFEDIHALSPQTDEEKNELSINLSSDCHNALRPRTIKDNQKKKSLRSDEGLTAPTWSGSPHGRRTPILGQQQPRIKKE